MILVFFGSIGYIMIINFLFNLDELKNNLDGQKIQYYDNGQKSTEISFKDGKYNGPFIRWYQNGKRESEIIYEDFKKVSWKSWKEDGSLNERNYKKNSR